MYQKQGGWRIWGVPIILISVLLMHRLDQFFGFIFLDTPWLLAALSINSINEDEAIGHYNPTTFEKLLAWNLTKENTFKVLRSKPHLVMSYYSLIRDIKSSPSSEVKLDRVMFSVINKEINCGGFIQLALNNSKLKSSSIAKDMLDVVRESPVSCKN